MNNVRQGLRVSRPGDGHERRATETGRAAARGAPRVTSSPAGTRAALPDDLQAHFGRSLGHKFGSVRIHDDTAAATLTNSLRASAVTAGTDIYFRPGSYRPDTREGLGLIGHELVHVMQQAGASRRLDRKTLTEEEAENSAPPRADPLSATLGADPELEKFTALMRERYGTKTVRRGTLSEQASQIASQRAELNPGATRGTLDPATWKEWSPPSGWETYRNILRAVASFARDFGGLPKIDQVIFYDVAYEIDRTGRVQPNPDVGASYGAGQLSIYRAAVRSDARPTGRSGVPYPGRQADLEQSTSEQAGISRTITHELGHGVGEAAVGPGKQGPDPNMYDDYRLVAGWTKYRPAAGNIPAADPALYDAGVPEVVQNLKDNKTPPENYHITLYNWNEGRWVEQPVTAYSTVSPGEDFAEAIMAYLKFPDVLQARSPRRFKFISERKAKWLPGKKPSVPAAQQASQGPGNINTPPQ